MTDGSCCQPDKPSDEKSKEKKYDIYNAEMKHEDNMINKRMNWLLTSQSILLIAFIQLLDKDKPSIVALVTLVGLTSSGLFLVAMYAGLICFWLYHSKIQILGLDNETYPQVCRSITIMIAGHIANFIIPLVFTVVWLYLFINY